MNENIEENYWNQIFVFRVDYFKGIVFIPSQNKSIKNVMDNFHIYTPTKVRHHSIFLSIYSLTSILLKQ